MSNNGVSITSIVEMSARFPGFRFSPTDTELISHYLKRKIEGADLSGDVIAEVEICKFEPWDLPAKSIIQSDHEWVFFSPTHKKYPSGSQAKRATQAGFWKATGKERDIKTGNNVIGTKRTLVFHIGRSPKGTRTDWIIHEYYLKENQDDKCQAPYVICRLRKKQDSVTTNPSSEAGSLIRLSPEPVILHAAAAPRVCNDLQQIQMGVCRNEENALLCKNWRRQFAHQSRAYLISKELQGRGSYLKVTELEEALRICLELAIKIQRRSRKK